MTTEFMKGFLVGLKDGPRLFFAPLVGAVNGICDETRRALASGGYAHAEDAWTAFLAGLKDGPRLFIAPLVGAVNGIRDATRRELASDGHEGVEDTRG
jgi:hypothetical protein